MTPAKYNENRGFGLGRDRFRRRIALYFKRLDFKFVTPRNNRIFRAINEFEEV
jgi:hypothetical protein